MARVYDSDLFMVVIAMIGYRAGLFSRLVSKRFKQLHNAHVQRVEDHRYNGCAHGFAYHNKGSTSVAAAMESTARFQMALQLQLQVRHNRAVEYAAGRCAPQDLIKLLVASHGMVIGDHFYKGLAERGQVQLLQWAAQRFGCADYHSVAQRATVNGNHRVFMFAYQQDAAQLLARSNTLYFTAVCFSHYDLVKEMTVIMPASSDAQQSILLSTVSTPSRQDMLIWSIHKFGRQALTPIMFSTALDHKDIEALKILKEADCPYNRAECIALAANSGCRDTLAWFELHCGTLGLSELQHAYNSLCNEIGHREADGHYNWDQSSLDAMLDHLQERITQHIK